MKTKVLIIASPWLGGSGSVAFRMGEYLSKNGFEVFSLSYEIPFKTNLKKTNVKYMKLDSFKYPLFPFPLYELSLAEEIVRLVKKNNISIIHAHYGILFGHAAALAKTILESEGVYVKLIITMHGSDVLGFDLEKPGTIIPKSLTSWTLRVADEVTIASQNLLQYTESIYKVSRDYKIIPNFIDTVNFSRTNYSFENPTMLHISNFRKVKQAPLVAAVFAKVKKVVKNSNLIFIGDGPELSATKKYVKLNKIKDVTFLGKIDDEKLISKYYNSSHLLIIPSIYENFSLAALESQACGTPVIGSNSGGNPELVIDGQTGLLCSHNDVDTMANNAINLLTDYKKWLKFSESAQLHVKKFDTETVMNSYIDLYRISPEYKSKILSDPYRPISPKYS